MKFAAAALIGAVYAAPEFNDDPKVCKDLSYKIYTDATCTTESVDDTTAAALVYNNTILAEEFNCRDSSIDQTKISTKTTCTTTELTRLTYSGSSDCTGDNTPFVVKFGTCMSNGGDSKWIKMTMAEPKPDPTDPTIARAMFASVSAAVLGLVASQF